MLSKFFKQTLLMAVLSGAFNLNLNPASGSQSHVWALSASIGAPELISAELVRKLGLNHEAFLHSGFLFFPFQRGQGNIASVGAELGFRYSPEKTWWFLGLAGGYRRVSARLDLSNMTLDGQSVIADPIALVLHGIYLKPSFGLKWKISETFSMQSELGFQIPMWGTGGLLEGKEAFLEPYAQTLSASQNIAFERLSQMVFPAFTAIRFVWLL